MLFDHIPRILTMYDENNVFAKILREEIPCKKFYETQYALVFEDLFPQRKIHMLVIPKGKYIDLDDFNANATKDEVVGFFRAISEVSTRLKIQATEGGYRVISNIGSNGGQEVPHLHFHILGGERVGRMLSAKTRTSVKEKL